ncbi:zinc finger protein RFP-like isoform X3 [Pelodiscus sinensis]|uniref:zinc finger protein RFP-like isoform X3 n=1 Tax=Pelodiscus sinensis TaxID=13735 RepID=UPI003F6C12BA
MASGNLARSFQDEVTCPICLEYFTDPVSIECGHSFCRACLSRCWGESEPNFCPQCRETIPQRHLRPNYQLGNLVELVKRLQLPAGPAPEGQPGCERHQEALKLFCQEDQAPICVVCDRSRAHRAHTVVPIEEAAQECKEQILSCLQRLREERDALRGLESDWAKESERLLRQTDVERQLVGWECERLRKFLAERERLLLARLGELDKEIGRRREEHAARLGEDISRLSTLISELEEKCRQPALELLQGVRSAVSRGEEATSPHPAPKCPELERRIRDFPGENSLQGAVTGFLGTGRRCWGLLSLYAGALAAERGLRRARGFAGQGSLDDSLWLLQALQWQEAGHWAEGPRSGPIWLFCIKIHYKNKKLKRNSPRHWPVELAMMLTQCPWQIVNFQSLGLLGNVFFYQVPRHKAGAGAKSLTQSHRAMFWLLLFLCHHSLY